MSTENEPATESTEVGQGSHQKDSNESLTTAPLFERLAAACIDTTIVLLLAQVFATIAFSLTGAPRGVVSACLATLDSLFRKLPFYEVLRMPLACSIAVLLVIVIVGFVYGSVTEASPLRATIGKWLCGLRVIGMDGKPISIIRSFIRNLYRTLSFVVGGYGLIIAADSPQGLTLHDSLAGTIVVKCSGRSTAFSVLRFSVGGVALCTTLLVLCMPQGASSHQMPLLDQVPTVSINNNQPTQPALGELSWKGKRQKFFDSYARIRPAEFNHLDTRSLSTPGDLLEILYFSRPLTVIERRGLDQIYNLERYSNSLVEDAVLTLFSIPLGEDLDACSADNFLIGEVRYFSPLLKSLEISGALDRTTTFEPKAIIDAGGLYFRCSHSQANTALTADIKFQPQLSDGDSGGTFRATSTSELRSFKTLGEESYTSDNATIALLRKRTSQLEFLFPRVLSANAKRLLAAPVFSESILENLDLVARASVDVDINAEMISPESTFRNYRISFYPEDGSIPRVIDFPEGSAPELLMGRPIGGARLRGRFEGKEHSLHNRGIMTLSWSFGFNTELHEVK